MDTKECNEINRKQERFEISKTEIVPGGNRSLGNFLWMSLSDTQTSNKNMSWLQLDEYSLYQSPVTFKWESLYSEVLLSDNFQE
jgi:hypothetical protein